MTATDRRFVVVSPDLKTAAGFDTRPGAETAALAFGEGAHVIDTESSPYQPSTMAVEDGELAYIGFGQFDHRLGANEALIDSLRKGYPPLVAAFLARGADPNAPDKRGALALNWAVVAGNADCLRLLIEAGADVQARDREGTTALALARTKGHADLERMLLDAGAKD